MSFQALLQNEAMVKALAMQNITEPTAIQEQVIPLLMEGKDVIGQAHHRAAEKRWPIFARYWPI